jgi:hypothetical protein
VNWNLRMSLICISLVTMYLFMGLLAICIIILGEMSIQIFASFFIWLVGFLFLSVGFHCLFLM